MKLPGEVDEATFATISMKLCSNFQIEQGKYNFDTRRGQHEPGNSRGSRRQPTRFRIVLGFLASGIRENEPFLLTPWSVLCVSLPRAGRERSSPGKRAGARARCAVPEPVAAAGGGAARPTSGGASRDPCSVRRPCARRHMGDAAASSVEACGRASSLKPPPPAGSLSTVAGFAFV
jgi:hypothetical protein